MGRDVSLLSEFLNRRKRQEKFLRRQICRKPFSTTTSFTKQGNVSKLEANDVKEQGKGNKSNAGEAR